MDWRKTKGKHNININSMAGILTWSAAAICNVDPRLHANWREIKFPEKTRSQTIIRYESHKTWISSYYDQNSEIA